MKLQTALPAPPQDSAAPAHRSRPPVLARVPKILVADDHDSARRAMTHTLSRAGFDVAAATDGEAAWNALQNDHYDLLITDHDMPRLTGLELIERIRAAGMSLPVILASASIAAEDMGEYAHLHIAAVVSKPFAFRDFLDAVTQALPKPAEVVPRVAAPPAKLARRVHNHVLIADDDPTVRGSLAAVLESEGYVVAEATNGVEAVARAIEHTPDLLLLDLNMPVADGWTAFSQLEQITPLLPVIVITARPYQYHEAVRVGVDAFMEKPLNIPMLMHAIKRLTTEDEARHVNRITNRAFVTQLLDSAGTR